MLALRELLHNLKDRDWDANPIYKIDENEAKRIIEGIETINGWIPCSERLPDTPHYYEEDEFRESDFILIYTKINDIENESNIYVAQYCIDDGDKTGYFVVPFCGDTFREGVTAWMPLPKPYKAESEEV
jgi:hypothetical protein